MNREIMFRGKRMDNGDWVYGLLLANKLGAYIITEENPHECTQYGYIEIDEYSRVDPETVGQYTGLKDKNGVKIFVGDIICYNTFVGCRGIVFVGCRGIVSSGRYEQDGSGDEYAPSECIGFFIERKWVDFDDYFAVYGKTISLLEVQGLEVIGNIHDNPELLGV